VRYSHIRRAYLVDSAQAQLFLELLQAEADELTAHIDASYATPGYEPPTNRARLRAELDQIHQYMDNLHNRFHI
jgi:hypothetical protein